MKRPLSKAVINYALVIPTSKRFSIIHPISPLNGRRMSLEVASARKIRWFLFQLLYCSFSGTKRVLTIWEKRIKRLMYLISYKTARVCLEKDNVLFIYCHEIK